MDSRSSIPDSQNDPSNLRRPQSFAKWAAIISVWSPFVAIIFSSTLFTSFKDAPIERAIRVGEAMFGGGGLLAVTGMAFACFALRATRRVGRRGVFGRAIFGLIANGLLVCAAVGLICSLENEYTEIQKLKAQASAPLSPEAAARRLERARKIMDRTAGRMHGDAALVARASSEYLKKLRMIGDDYGAKIKALNGVFTGKLSSIQSRDDLRSRQVLIQQFIDANDLFQNFAARPDIAYSNELTAAGVSSNGFATAMQSFTSTPFATKPWDANRAFAQSQLQIVQFLETNWGRWSYTVSNDAIEFDNAAMTKGFKTLLARADQMREELTRAQKKKSGPP
jgi:hypothetical protein